MQNLVSKLVGVHSSSRVYGDRQASMDLKDENMIVTKTRAQSAEAEHPVVRTHPETGRKSLFVNDHYTLRFKDMSEQESNPLLQYLLTHAVRPEFTCRFRWQKNSIAIWDNRCLLHNPISDYFGERRYLHRVAIAGDKPT